MSDRIWDDYVAALEEMSTAGAVRESQLDAIERTRQEARSRAEREASESSHDLSALSRRAEALAIGIRRFATEVGVREAAPTTAAPPAVNRIAVALAEQEKRLTRAQGSRDWLARFAKSAADQAAAAHAAALEAQRAAAAAAAQAQQPVAAPAPEPAPARSRRPLLLWVGIGVGVIAVFAVVVIIVASIH